MEKNRTEDQALNIERLTADTKVGKGGGDKIDVEKKTRTEKSRRRGSP